MEALKALTYQAVGIEGTDELVPRDEIEASEKALRDYRTRRHTGLSPEALKLKLFGKNVLLSAMH